MHFLHLNINSVLPKIDEPRLIAKNTNGSSIGLCGTKLDESIQDKDIEINGYTLERCDRNSRGGVACYVRNDIAFNIRENVSEDFENIFLDILLPKRKPILVGVVYRPPDQSDFLDHFTEALSNTHISDKQLVYILGDFYIDINTNLNLTKTYKEICSLHGLKQLIESSTKIPEKTSTLIGLILINSFEIFPIWNS